MANQLFVANGAQLGPPEITYDVDQEIWEYVTPDDDDSGDEDFSVTFVSSGSDIESDIHDILPEDKLYWTTRTFPILCENATLKMCNL
jgi:hypothetical protein